MKPILFAENSTTFTSNGIGRLAHAISCSVTEQRNGIYELEMVYPMDGQHYSDIGLRKIIGAKPSANASLQAFRIYKISKPINGKVTIYGQHISYDLSKNTTMPFSVTASSSACNTTLQALKSNAVESCPFTFWTNNTTAASYSQKLPSSIRQRLGGIEGSVLDQFGGEYEFDNLTVKLHNHRGATRNDITLRYGKNITDLEQEENINNTVTGIVPYWTDTDNEEVVTLTEKAVYSSHASQYSNHLTVPLDLSSQWENKPTESQLRTAANVYVNQSDFGVPTVSVKVSFVNLADTADYKDILPLQNVNLCDEITVQFEKLGISTTAEIVETEYDVLKERYISIQVGSLRSSFSKTVNDIEAGTMQAISDSGKRVFAEANTEAQDLINNATAWLTATGGVIRALKNSAGEWTDILCMSATATAHSGNVLRLNVNGIGFSSTGWEGTFTQAWTLDGKLMVGGTNVPSITCYDSDDNIIFQATRQGLIWNADNSWLDSYGKLHAQDAVLSGRMVTEQTYTESGVTHTRKVSIDSGAIDWYLDNTLIGTIDSRSTGFWVSVTGDLHLEATSNITMMADRDIVMRGYEVDIGSNDYAGNVMSGISMDYNGVMGIFSKGGIDIHRSSQDSQGTFNGSEISMGTDNIFLDPGNHGNGDLKIRKNYGIYTGQNGTLLKSVSLSMSHNENTVRNICVDMDIYEDSDGLHWSWGNVTITYVTSVNYNLSTTSDNVRNGIVTTS